MLICLASGSVCVSFAISCVAEHAGSVQYVAVPERAELDEIVLNPGQQFEGNDDLAVECSARARCHPVLHFVRPFAECSHQHLTKSVAAEDMCMLVFSRSRCLECFLGVIDYLAIQQC